jgi:uncharacterized YigZ family protein
MRVFSYTTIARPCQGAYREKGSKFLAFAYPVSSEAQIRERIDHLKKEYFDARHHCFAWVLGPERKVFRAFDDGEPNHSAGDPILGQIRSRNLTNVLIVVVRYFGGVKLGVSGLITAYKTATADALEKAISFQVEVKFAATLLYGYSSTPEIMRLIREFSLEISRQGFTDRCEMKLLVPLKIKEVFLEKVELLKATGTDLEISPLVDL